MRPREEGGSPLAVEKRNLTDLFIKKLKPSERVTKIYDLKQRGLVVQVQPSGSAAWKVYYSLHGRPRWYHIGRTDAVGLAYARKVAAQIMLRVALGDDPQVQRTAQRASGTFREVAEAYLSESQNKSVWQYERQLRAHALPLWGSMPAGSITDGRPPTVDTGARGNSSSPSGRRTSALDKGPHPGGVILL